MRPLAKAAISILLACLLLESCATTLDTRDSGLDALESVGQDGSSANAEAVSKTLETSATEVPIPPVSAVFVPIRSVRTLPNGVIDSYTERAYQPGSTNLISETTYLAANEIRSEKRFSYRDNTHVKITSSGANGAVESVILQTYDDQRNLLFEDQLDASYEPIFSFSYVYQSGVLKTWELIDSQGRVLSTVTYEYNEAGDVMRITTYNEDGEIQEYIIFSYDNSRALESEKTIDPTGREIERIDYSYDFTERLIESTLTSSGLYRKTRYHYDEYGNSVREDALGPEDRPLYSVSHSYAVVEQSVE